MKKLMYLFNQLFKMIWKHKIYFFAPLFIMIIILAVLAIYIGPSAVIAFIYAGV